jgi:hypothetical protein
LGCALGAIVLALGLLTAWQIIVVALAIGSPDALAVSAAGLAAGMALLTVHELGHVLVGWVVGLPPLSMTVGFVRVEWRDGRLTMKPNFQLFRPAAIAHVASNTVRWRTAAMIAGGPLANLTVAGVCLASAAAINPGPPAGVPVAARSSFRDVAVVWPGSTIVSWLNVTGLVSLFLGVFTLVPGRSAGLRTDGGQLLDLARQHPPRATALRG